MMNTNINSRIPGIQTGKYLLMLSFLLILSISCKRERVSEFEFSEKVSDQITFNHDYTANGFDYAVGKPDGKGYYNAQKFTENNHLGDDWNGVSGGNTDLGDPIYAVADGFVTFAEDIGGGWGGVVRIIHQLPDGKMVESLYAHCQRIDATPGNYVRKGTQIGTIGNVNGIYYAHLHLEIRTEINKPIGGGYSNDITGYANPTTFIDEHRTIASN